MKERIASHVASIHNVVMLAGLVALGLTGSMGGAPAPVSDTLARRVQAGKVTDALPQSQIALAPAPGTTLNSPFSNFKVDNYYEQLRNKLNWLPVRFAGDILKTPDPQSRILLAQSAARRAGLEEVGLSYRDVYGIINAETSWIPRMGSSKDGTPRAAAAIARFPPGVTTRSACDSACATSIGRVATRQHAASGHGAAPPK